MGYERKQGYINIVAVMQKYFDTIERLVQTGLTIQKTMKKIKYHFSYGTRFVDNL